MRYATLPLQQNTLKDAPDSARTLRSGRASYEYIPALDGFRAISILLVVFSHAGLGEIVPGGLGVVIFFAISGFLLTRQMIVEIEHTGTLNLSQFYLRRVFRLAPALLLYITVFSLILHALGAEITGMHILSGVFYFSNFYHIFIGYPPHSPMPILWSLSVEEHYYLLFPFLMIAFRHRLPALLPWLCALVFAALVWRIILFNMCSIDPSHGICGLPERAPVRVTHSTDTVFDCILYGAIAALALHYYNTAIRRLLINPAANILAVAVLMGTLLYRDPMFRDTFRLSFQSISVTIIIINVLFGEAEEKIRSWLSTWPSVMIGRMSYSLYLFHYGILCILYDKNHMEGLQGATDLILYYVSTAICAAISYFLVEKPAVKLRKRFGSHAKTEDAA